MYLAEGRLRSGFQMGVFSMRNFNQGVVAAALGTAIAVLSASAFAQTRDPLSSRDVTEEVIPAPANGDIMVRFNQTSRIYFKRPVKEIKLEDGLSVKAVPETEHIVAFTGLSPGRTSVTLTSTDGHADTWGMVTVLNEPHEVRVYQQSETNKQTGERRSDSSSDIGGYVILTCNEVRCDEKEPDLQSRLPK